MTAEPDTFRSAVQDSWGRWPGPPATWSYSSLRQAEECPRQWMLSRATYPALWPRPGYPPQPISPAILGDVVHRVLETIVGGLSSRGCTSPADPAAVAIMKELGGYSKITERAIQEQIDRLAGNPRASGRAASLHAGLLRKVPSIRQTAQSILSRTAFRLPVPDTGALTPAARGPLNEGSHPEVELRAPGLRLAGRADLITLTKDGCEITDYKTGSLDQRHADQLRIYALLWSLDSALNPASRLATRLVIAHASGDVLVEPPSRADLDVLAAQVDERIVVAEASLADRPPQARPAARVCRTCGVRQLCDEYWAGLDDLAQAAPADGEPDFFDYEGTVASQNGPRSWKITARAIARPALLIRAPPTTPGLHPGVNVRLLNLLRESEPDSPVPAAAVTGVSEIFLLEAQR